MKAALVFIIVASAAIFIGLFIVSLVLVCKYRKLEERLREKRTAKAKPANEMATILFQQESQSLGLNMMAMEAARKMNAAARRQVQ